VRVLVTGGTGKLGRELLPKLSEAGHSLVALGRRPLPPGVPATWARGDLSTGEGIDDAMRNCEAVVHAATAGFGDRYSLRWAVFHSAAVDVRGTRALLEAAERMRIEHFVFTSIVGIDRVPLFPTIYRYFKHKLVAEASVRRTSLSWTIARITQFHSFLDQMFAWRLRLPGPVLLPETLGQPIDASDAADAVIASLEETPARQIREFGGPEVMDWRKLVDAWVARRGVTRTIRFIRVPGRLGRALRHGALTCPERSSGSITWEQWLSRT
jgi:nucleoside-diphosphate-sugar epimerase